MIGFILLGIVVASGVAGAVLASFASISGSARDGRKRAFSLVARGYARGIHLLNQQPRNQEARACLETVDGCMQTATAIEEGSKKGSFMRTITAGRRACTQALYLLGDEEFCSSQIDLANRVEWS